jgi:hypothetical protein
MRTHLDTGKKSSTMLGSDSEAMCLAMSRVREPVARLKRGREVDRCAHAHRPV